MKIKNVAAAGLKGLIFDWDLAPVTLVVGDSFSGKTAVLDALRLGLLGYHPGLGKRPGDTFRLSGASNLVVDITLDDGKRIGRRWARDGQSIKYTGPGPEDALLPLIALDSREYFSLTAAQRLSYLFARMDPAKVGLTPADIAAKVRGASLVGTGPDAEAAQAEIAEVIHGLVEAAKSEEATIQQFADTIVMDLLDRKKEAAASARAARGAVQTAARVADFAAAPRNVAAELRAAKEALGVAQAAKATLGAQAQEASSLVARIAEANKPQPDYAAQIEDAKKALAALPPMPKPDKDAAMDDYKTETIVTTAEADLKRAEAAETEEAAQFAKDMKAKACPHCLSSRKGWQEHIEARHVEMAAKLAEARVKAKVILMTAKAVHKKAAARFAKAQAEIDELARIEIEKERIEGRIRSLQGLASEITSRAKEVEGLTVRLKTLPPTDAEALRKTVLALELAQARVADLEASQQRWVAAQAEENARRRSVAEAGKQEARAAVFKAAAESAQAVQAEAISRAVAGLIDVANKFTAGIMRAPIEYRDGDVGYVRDGVWVGHGDGALFSGTEAALAYAGLAVALAASAPARIVLMDELGVMDERTRVLAVERMRILVADGTIDQFVGCDVGKKGWWQEKIKCGDDFAIVEVV